MNVETTHWIGEYNRRAFHSNVYFYATVASFDWVSTQWTTKVDSKAGGKNPSQVYHSKELKAVKPEKQAGPRLCDGQGGGGLRNYY